MVELVQRYEAAGVDQVIFVQQAGPNKHEHICESLELFGEKVLPHFADGREEREAAKRERLAEACERALARRAPARTPDPGYVITPRGEPRPGAGDRGRAPRGRRTARERKPALAAGHGSSAPASRPSPRSCAGAATRSSSARSARTPACG